MEPIPPAIPDTPQPLSPFRERRFRVILIIIAVAVCVAWLSAAPASFPTGETVFSIEKGRPLVGVANDLEDAGYIRSKLVFSTLVTLMGGERRVSPGDYQFTEKEGVFGIAWRIAAGKHGIARIKITIPEGKTVPEIATVLDAKLADFDSAAFRAAAAQYEGYLFPETYFFFPTVTPEEVASEMRAMFDTQTADLFTESLLAGRTQTSVVIMASLIEREAHGSDDRAVIAAILYKRLELGMRLQVDATVAYAVGKGDDILTKADFAVDSPYNTYRHGGLPPGPIANPGLEAIKAALSPAKTDYLYYLHDKNGSIHYAKTYAEHQKNIAKYLK